MDCIFVSRISTRLATSTLGVMISAWRGKTLCRLQPGLLFAAAGRFKKTFAEQGS